MKFLLKKIFCLLIISAVIICCFSSAASANEDVFNNNNIICVAHRGDWHSFPENSIEAINAALSYDAISVDIRMTSDSHAVLFADETMGRMCVDAQGNSVNGKVSDYSLKQIEGFYLRQANGSSDKPKTEFHVAELKNVLSLFNEKTLLILNVQPSDFEAVYKITLDCNAIEKVYFRINAHPNDIIKMTENKKLNVIGNYQGNIIFLATNASKKFFANGINTVELGSKNGHGVLYDHFLMKRFNQKNRAMVSMVNGRCGGRTDSETGWDDLISRGYSVIETDYPSELSEYITQVSSVRTELENFVDIFSGTDLSKYNTESENRFTSALKQAKYELGTISSFSELSNARNELQSAHDKLTVGEKKPVTLSFSFSIGKAITVVLCGLAFVLFQIYLYKNKDKNGGNTNGK